MRYTVCMTKSVRVASSLILALAIGCASSQQATAYKTLGAAVTAVDTAMKVYGSECRAGSISVADQARVQKAYETYQGVIGPVIRAHGLTAGVPQDVAASVSSLLALLQGLGVKL